MHWAASAKNTGCSPLHRLLSAREAGSTDPKHAQRGPTAGHSVPMGRGGIRDRCATSAVAAGPVPLLPLDVAPYTRQVDTAWRRTSYLVDRPLHDVERGPGGFREDEPDEIAEEISVSPRWRALASPFADPIAAGAAFETLVHGVLETVDTDADDLTEEVATGAVSDWWHSPSPGEYRCAG